MADHPGGAHGLKAILAALAANMAIAFFKAIAFVITGSGAMLAEAIHSLADSGNQALLLLGHRKARKAPDELHQFGYGRERFFWAFVVAIVLFVLGAALSIIDGIEKLVHPHELDSVGVAIAVLLAALCMEGYSFRTAMHEARPLKGDASWWQFIRRSKNPELPVVLLEDTAALIGLVLALIAIGLAQVTGEPKWDAIGTLAIGTLLAMVAAVLSVEMRSLLLGESAAPNVQRDIETALRRNDKVRRIIHLRTEHLGPEDILVGAKLEFDSDLTIGELALVIDEVEVDVRAAAPHASTIYIEPDVFRDRDESKTETSPGP